MRRLGCILASLIVLALGSTLASAQSAYPNRPIRILIPYGPGGLTDVVARHYAERLRAALGQNIIVENKPGGGGTLGPGTMARTAKPDGYTIAQVPITIFRLPFMTKTTLDPSKDITYIAGLTAYTFGVMVKADSPWKTFKELIEHARANPGKLKYGSPGTGTSLHIGMEQIA
jgi:tripartite-type tricarboxylate transporter receptor subunit TctC